MRSIRGLEVGVYGDFRGVIDSGGCKRRCGRDGRCPAGNPTAKRTEISAETRCLVRRIYAIQVWLPLSFETLASEEISEAS